MPAGQTIYLYAGALFAGSLFASNRRDKLFSSAHREETKNAANLIICEVSSPGETRIPRRMRRKEAEAHRQVSEIVMMIL